MSQTESQPPDGLSQIVTPRYLLSRGHFMIKWIHISKKIRGEIHSENSKGLWRFLGSSGGSQGKSWKIPGKMHSHFLPNRTFYQIPGKMHSHFLPNRTFYQIPGKMHSHFLPGIRSGTPSSNDKMASHKTKQTAPPWMHIRDTLDCGSSAQFETNTMTLFWCAWTPIRVCLGRATTWP